MPLVSIIVPCYNEVTTIGLLLEGLYSQTYSRAAMEVIIADGLSTDGTRRQISIFQARYPDLTVRIIDNPQQTIPAALNRAIAAARGAYLIRLDAHSKPRPEYVERCIADLEQGLGDNIGGIWEIKPGADDWRGRSIAAAAAHPLGVGDAQYRYTNQAQAVDTVPFGAFSKKLVERVGPFDETLLTNEDYEFNTRVRESGGIVWLDPAIRSLYYARPDFMALSRQYWRYGFWKARMLRLHPKSLRWRQALPPLFILSLAVMVIFSVWLPIARWFLLFDLGSYSAVLLAVGINLALTKKDPGLFLGVPLAIAIMHLSWGTAFLRSVIR